MALEAFRNIKWPSRSETHLEDLTTFISGSSLASSYIYKGVEPLSDDELDTAGQGNTRNPKEATRVIPGCETFPNNMPSLLSTKDQAMCLIALKIMQSGIPKDKLNADDIDCINLYNVRKAQILQENDQFAAEAVKAWRQFSKSNAPKKTHEMYAGCLWQRKLERPRFYSRFYKAKKMLSLATNAANEVEVTHLQNVLELGTVAKFSKPTLAHKFFMNFTTLPSQNDAPNCSSKLTVSHDTNIDKLLQSHSPNIVISSSGLKQLMDNTTFNNHWEIPVVIKEIKRSDGDTKKVVFVDKPFTNRKPNGNDIINYCHKTLVKTNLCTSVAITFPNEEEPCVKEEGKTAQNSKVTPELPASEVSDEEETFTRIKRKVHHNVSYRLWYMKPKLDYNPFMKTSHVTKEITILIRSKLDGCEVAQNESLTPVVVVPKMEFVLHYGATYCSASELSRQWTALFFRPFSNLYRVRIANMKSEVVSTERCTMQRINNEASSLYNYKPHLSLGLLYNILAEFTDLPTGSYLLRHTEKDGPFVALMEETEKRGKEVYDLHEAFDLRHCQPSSVLKQPTAIDPNYILPVHEVFKKLPGTFKPHKAEPKKKVDKRMKRKARRKAGKGNAGVAQANRTKPSS